MYMSFFWETTPRMTPIGVPQPVNCPKWMARDPSILSRKLWGHMSPHSSPVTSIEDVDEDDIG